MTKLRKWYKISFNNFMCSWKLLLCWNILISALFPSYSTSTASTKIARQRRQPRHKLQKPVISHLPLSPHGAIITSTQSPWRLLSGAATRNHPNLPASHLLRHTMAKAYTGWASFLLWVPKPNHFFLWLSSSQSQTFPWVYTPALPSPRW